MHPLFLSSGGGGGAHRALCPHFAKSRLFWTRFPPIAKVSAVTTVFPVTGLLRFLLSPKTEITTHFYTSRVW